MLPRVRLHLLAGPLRMSLALLVLVLALPLAACGEGDDPREQLERSVLDVANEALDEEGSYSTAAAVRCDDGGPRARCEVGVSTGTSAYEDRYLIVVGDDGCWRAVRDGLSHATGRAADDPPPRVMRGCVA